MIAKAKQALLTKLFTEWVRDEYDLEALDMAAGLITQKTDAIRDMVDMANRTEVIGFKKYWDMAYIVLAPFVVVIGLAIAYITEE